MYKYIPHYRGAKRNALNGNNFQLDGKRKKRCRKLSEELFNDEEKEDGKLMRKLCEWLYIYIYVYI